ncbi:MAG: ATP-dependent Clp protease ATP-binding subunit [Candidatus Moraniibacteriota bacterium]|nr:MAG: ATP-dependent Clp protease ATP-binding subunit [Candidatus Moranbacteria bacterium]
MIPSLNRFTFHAKTSLQEAEKIAFGCGKAKIYPEHLLLAIFLRRGSVGASVLTDIGLQEDSFAFLFENTSLIKKTKTISKKTIPLSESLKEIVLASFQLARNTKSPFIGTEHIVRAILRHKNKSPVIHSIFSTAKKQRKVLPKNSRFQSSPIPNGFFKPSEFPFRIPQDNMNEEEEISALEEFCIDLNERSSDKRELPLVGRESVLKRMINILGRKTKNNILLVGDPGVGKTALVSGLATLLACDKIPQLKGKIIHEVDLAMIVSGTSFRGEFEARIKDIILEATQDPRVILFIDEIHTLIGTGNVSGSLDAANILKPALARGDVRCIGATTFSEYKKHIEKDSALDRRFQRVIINEPTREEAIEMLDGIKENFEKHHKITFTKESVTTAVDLSIRHFTDRFLPDKAIDLLDESASSKRSQLGDSISPQENDIFSLRKNIADALKQKKECIEKEEYEEAIELTARIKHFKEKLFVLKEDLKNTVQKKFPELSSNDIATTVSEITGISQKKILSQKTKNITSLERELNRHIIGQKKATDSIARSLMRSFCGLSDQNKPLGSFLLLGPSGVGKTLTGKILGQALFDRPDALIKVNMSEFQERHQLSGLIGAPAGYIGYGEGGKFTEKVRQRPHSVILFDEIEKAHPDILNILLQILEEGTLQDGEGRNVSFRESIILMTSNIGSTHIKNLFEKKLGFSHDKKASRPKFSLIESKVRQELQQALRPELLDRLDQIIIYRPLTLSNLQKIANIALEGIAQRLKNKESDLVWNEEVLSLLAKKAYKPNAGARYIRKITQEIIEDLIANAILRKKIVSKKIFLEVKNNKIVIASIL